MRHYQRTGCITTISTQVGLRTPENHLRTVFGSVSVHVYTYSTVHYDFFNVNYDQGSIRATRTRTTLHVQYVYTYNVVKVLHLSSFVTDTRVQRCTRTRTFSPHVNVTFEGTKVRTVGMLYSTCRTRTCTRTCSEIVQQATFCTPSDARNVVHFDLSRQTVATSF